MASVTAKVAWKNHLVFSSTAEYASDRHPVRVADSMDTRSPRGSPRRRRRRSRRDGPEDDERQAQVDEHLRHHRARVLHAREAHLEHGEAGLHEQHQAPGGRHPRQAVDRHSFHPRPVLRRASRKGSPRRQPLSAPAGQSVGPRARGCGAFGRRAKRSRSGQLKALGSRRGGLIGVAGDEDELVVDLQALPPRPARPRGGRHRAPGGCRSHRRSRSRKHTRRVERDQGDRAAGSHVSVAWRWPHRACVRGPLARLGWRRRSRPL